MDSTTATAPASQTEQHVRRLRALQRDGLHEEALRDAQSLARDLPENRDLLLIAATSLRHLRRTAEAMAALDRLEQLQPRFSRLHQERGQCYVTLKDAPRAIEAFLLAVNINPALPASWSMLEGLYRMTRDVANAATAAAHVATQKDLPPEVVTELFDEVPAVLQDSAASIVVARRDDEPIATAMVYASDEVASLQWVGTVPAGLSSRYSGRRSHGFSTCNSTGSRFSASTRRTLRA